MTTDNSPITDHEGALQRIAENIDIPPNLRESAVARYSNVGKFLDNDPSIARFGPEIYPQGSFALGTVVRPLGDADEFDLDLVCKLDISKNQFSMADLKTMIGRSLASYYRDRKSVVRLDDKRRCWTMEYRESEDAGFHMDILPAIPQGQEMARRLFESRYRESVPEWMSQTAIAITDKEHSSYNAICDDWLISNPKGYQSWFTSAQSEFRSRRATALFEAQVEKIYASVDEVPDTQLKSPLQSTVQLLKRHRDKTYEKDSDQPISIIITTLAALTYQNSDRITDTLRTALKNMDSHILESDGVLQVLNPLNPMENFADKWQETPRKQAVFFQWLEKARADFAEYLEGSSFDAIPHNLTEALTERTLSRVVPNFVVQNRPRSQLLETEAAMARAQGVGTKPWSQ